MSSLPRISWKPREVAQMTGLDYDFVLEQIRQGAIPADKLGTTYRVPNSWVQERLGVTLIGDDTLTALAQVLSRAAGELIDHRTATA